MKRSPKQKFEDYADVIDAAIKRQKSKWQLNAINWFDFDDVEQIIKVHIHKKWDMWDQKRPLEPWIGRIISNQIRNLIRNHYGNYTKPCNNCQFSLGDNLCSITASNLQDSQCKLYEKWESQKKVGLELKTTLSMESHMSEISSRPDNDFCYESSIERLNNYMEKELNPSHYRAYMMLFFENCDEEEVAKFMGYKTNEKKRKAGYRQVKNLKKIFQAKAEEIMKKFDIIIHESN
jgi:RNA polymerase sigma factor (sigma-70 family)